MAFIFPSDKSDFTAPNGITYSWDATDEKWVVKTFKTTAADLDGYVTTEEFTTDQQRQDEDIAVLEGLVKGISYLYIVENLSLIHI